MSSWEKIAREGNNLTQNRKCIKSRLSKEQNQNSTGACCLPGRGVRSLSWGHFSHVRVGWKSCRQHKSDFLLSLVEHWQ